MSLSAQVLFCCWICSCTAPSLVLGYYVPVDCLCLQRQLLPDLRNCNIILVPLTFSWSQHLHLGSALGRGRDSQGEFQCHLLLVVCLIQNFDAERHPKRRLVVRNIGLAHVFVVSNKGKIYVAHKVPAWYKTSHSLQFLRIKFQASGQMVSSPLI